VRFAPTDSYWYDSRTRLLGGRFAVLASVSVKGHDITPAATHFRTYWPDVRRHLPLPQMQTRQILHELGNLPHGARVLLLGVGSNVRPGNALFGGLPSACLATTECNDSSVGTVMRSSKETDTSWAGDERIDYICVKGTQWVKD
jgi:hypothetical protein